jgi:hypothetical protein
VSVLVTTLLVGCGVLVGRLIAQSPRRQGGSPPGADDASAAQTPAPKTTEEEPMKTLEGFPCQLGDVVIRAGGGEAWLAGALVFTEGDNDVAALFVAPEMGADRAVLARPASQELSWLTQRDDVVVIAGEPPTALEVAGSRYERRRRLPLRAARLGTGAPDLGPDVILAEYTGLGDDCLVVLVSKERVLAFRGEILAAGSYDVLPGKKT